MSRPPKKEASSDGHVTGLNSLDVGANNLAADEVRLVMAYRNSRDGDQKILVAFAEMQAVDKPRRLAPVLHLVNGGRV